MSSLLRSQRRRPVSAPPVHDESRVEAKDVPASPAPAPTLAHDFATIDIASAEQMASLAGLDAQRRTHLTMHPTEPRYDWGAAFPVQRSPDDLGRRIRAAQAGGSSLEPTVQERLESGLGADLSGVRVHTDGEANQLSQAVSATAFTTGSHIFFQAGAYRPHSGEGMRVLAHEAAHTVQQARGPVDGTPGPGGVSISDPSDSFEQAAETSAQRVVSGNSESGDVEEPAGDHPAAAPVPVQRIPEWLKFWKKSPPPPPPVPRAPPQEILPLLEEVRAQDIESEQVAPAAPAPLPAPVAARDVPFDPTALDEPAEENFAPEPPGPVVELREPRPASLRPGVAEQGKYKTKELIPKYRGEGEKRAKEKWVGGQYVGQTGELYNQSLGKLAVKYLSEEQRAPYEIRLKKDDNLFYWEKTGQVFNTKPMRSAVVDRVAGRAIFVMTESGKIYAADEGTETRSGMRTPEQEAGWRFNHSSFLAGEPVAGAGELVFEDGVLKGITNESGHYYPEAEHIRQVLQEFVVRGVSVTRVWVLLHGEGADWYVKAVDLILFPNKSKADFMKERIGSPTKEGLSFPVSPPAGSNVRSP